jgi:superfamily II DNA or RNA helicase
VEVYSHFFKVTQFSAQAEKAMLSICRELVQKTVVKIGKRYVEQNDRTFASRTKDKKDYRFNINMYERFLLRMGDFGISRDNIEHVFYGLYEPATADLEMAAGWKAREYQVPLIEFIKEPGPIKVLTLQTGQGKTATSLAAIADLKQRVGIVILARYFDKWISDVAENYGINSDRVITVQGFKQLRDVMKKAMTVGITEDVIVITSRSLQDYITGYELTRYSLGPKWLVPPEQLYELLGIGIRLIDETHQHFHLNFKLDLFTHIPKCIYLSATLESSDKFINEMYSIAYPLACRRSNNVYMKYIDVTAVTYHVTDYSKIRCSQRGNYNHTAYEQWIMKRKDILKNYLEMIYAIVDKEYLQKRKDSQRMLIFAATIELCEIIRDYLAKRIPALTVSKYNAEDEYNVLMESDITVSTLGSSGTAVDIKHLITVLMTTALSSKQSNLQALGRLRELRDYPEQTPHFLYLTCLDIPKHVTYQKDKLTDHFVGKVLTHRVIGYTTKI